ncbi:NAD(P)-binding domain-containing protein, partial [Patescibacteria group bacterium]|nr:NAD(P)-binding domain-containing protein [Patescibacteria group bacterium]
MKDLILIYNAFFDLIIRLLPQIKKREGVAFLVHPRDVKDVIEKYPFFKYFSKNTINWVLKHFWPITISQIEGITDKNNKPINGWVISCPLLAEYMLKNRKDAKKFIIKTAKLAEKKGAKMIGLGALTTSLTQGGLDIQDHTNCRIITGKLFTAKIVTDTTVNILKKLELNKEEITVSILGAAGSIGSASAQILAKKGFNKINLIDLSHKSEEINEIKKFMQKLNPKISITVSNKVKSVKDSDIIIAATNKPDALIKSKHLKQGAVIVDDAQPSDVDEEIIKNRKDVIVLEGGV